MGLLDQIVSGVSSLSGMNTGGLGQIGNNAGINLSGGGKGQLMSILLSMVASGKFGGFEGLLKQFNNNGMQNQLASWISTRQNEPVTAAQVEQALGTDAVNEIAQQAGVDQIQAAQGLAEVIPQLVDKMTPTGVMPQQDVISGVMGKLTSRF